MPRLSNWKWYYHCAECNRLFSEGEWRIRHSRITDGEDVHEECCMDCPLKRTSTSSLMTSLMTPYELELLAYDKEIYMSNVW